MTEANSTHQVEVSGTQASDRPQYFEEGRALRIVTVINGPSDLGVLRRLEHLDELQAEGT